MEFVHDLARRFPTFQGQVLPDHRRKSMGAQGIRAFGALHPLCLVRIVRTKAWPWMDNLIARILLKTDLKIVTTGGEIERILEQGWDKESRVINRAGKWTVRQVLAFAEHCEMVIGPETGVLNAVSMLPMPKIVFCPIRRTKT